MVEVWGMPYTENYERAVMTLPHCKISDAGVRPPGKQLHDHRHSTTLGVFLAIGSGSPLRVPAHHAETDTPGERNWRILETPGVPSLSMSSLSTTRRGTQIPIGRRRVSSPGFSQPHPGKRTDEVEPRADRTEGPS